MLSCRGEEYVDASKSRNYYYSRDKHHILYDSTIRVMGPLAQSNYIEVPANVSSFKVISTKFAKDDNRIFYTITPLVNVDYESFYWDEITRVPKDKKHVYFPNTQSDKLTIVEYADPKTYERLDLSNRRLEWYKDKKHYFYNHKKVEANKTTMSFASPLLPFDNANVFWVDSGRVCKRRYTGKITMINENILYDDSLLYFKADCDSLIKLIPSAGTDTIFKYLDKKHHVFIVSDKVFYVGIELPQADPFSFELISHLYAKDKNKVYYKNMPLSDSDPRSFEILSFKYSKDKNNVYENGNILKGYKPRDFRADAWGRYPVDPEYGKNPQKR